MIARSPKKLRSQPGVLLPGIEKSKRNIEKSSNIQSQILNSEMMDLNDDLTNAMNPEQMKEEILRLRQLNSTQNNQLVQLRRQTSENSGSAQDNRLIQTLVDGLRAINIDIKPPKFEENQNPNQFLEKLEKFYTIKHIQQSSRLSILDGAFDNRAKAWFDSQRNAFVDFNDFKTKFLAEFYSIPIRVQIKSNWLAKRFDSSKGNLQTYFLDQIKEAQYFLPQIEAYEMHYTIIQQMPIRVREALATVDFSDFEKISRALSQLDLTFTDKINNQRKQTQNQNQNLSNTQSQSYNENNAQKPRLRQVRAQQSQKGFCCACSCNKFENAMSVSSAGVQSCHDGSQPASLGAHSSHQKYDLPLPDVSLSPPPITMRMNHNPSTQFSGNLNFY